MLPVMANVGFPFSSTSPDFRRILCDCLGICLVTIDSMFYEIILGDEGPVVMPHDFGVMEAWHVRIAKSKANYITSIFSMYMLLGTKYIFSTFSWVLRFLEGNRPQRKSFPAGAVSNCQNCRNSSIREFSIFTFLVDCLISSSIEFSV